MTTDSGSSNDRMVIPMDPESNWDICPVCLDHLLGAGVFGVFPGLEAMRAHHEAHKAAGRQSSSAIPLSEQGM